LGLTLTLLGLIDQGCARVEEGLTEARQLDHPFTVAFVLSKVCAVEAAAGLLEEARQHAEELVALANQHGFPLWLGLGLLQHGRSLTTLGQVQDGLALLARGCQCRFKFPQMCRSKIPQSGGISVISRLTGDRWLHVWVDDRGGAAAVPGLAS